jgi:hypothetical protein
MDLMARPRLALCSLGLPMAASLLASVALAACTTSAPAEDDETGDEGNLPVQACAEPGSALLDTTEPAGEPDESLGFVCTNGWASDAPSRVAIWTVQLPWSDTNFGWSNTTMQAHPGGGVVLAHDALFARVDGDGELLWNRSTMIPSEARVVMAVEPAGTILLAVYDWSGGGSIVERYDADGDLIGAVTLPWNDPQGGEVWALVPDAGELLVGAYDLDQQGWTKTTVMRLDGAGNLLLRKATNMTNDGLLVANAANSLVFGRFPTFVLARDTGAVLGNLTPSAGQPLAVVGVGSEFMAASAAGGFGVGRYSSVGAEQWLQVYTRANLGGDTARAITADPDGERIVAVGTTSSLSFDGWWFGTQPQVIALDRDGDPLWTDRIDALGEANGVAFGADGGLYVTGLAEGVGGGQAPPLVRWLRRYQP